MSLTGAELRPMELEETTRDKLQDNLDLREQTHRDLKRNNKMPLKKKRISRKQK